MTGLTGYMLEEPGGAVEASCGLPPPPEVSGQVIPRVYAVIDSDPYA